MQRPNISSSIFLTSLSLFCIFQHKQAGKCKLMPKFTERVLDSGASGPKMLLTTMTILSNTDSTCWKHVLSTRWHNFYTDWKQRAYWTLMKERKWGKEEKEKGDKENTKVVWINVLSNKKPLKKGGFFLKHTTDLWILLRQNLTVQHMTKMLESVRIKCHIQAGSIFWKSCWNCWGISISVFAYKGNHIKCALLIWKSGSQYMEGKQ